MSPGVRTRLNRFLCMEMEHAIALDFRHRDVPSPTALLGMQPATFYRAHDAVPGEMQESRRFGCRHHLIHAFAPIRPSSCAARRRACRAADDPTGRKFVSARGGNGMLHSGDGRGPSPAPYVAPPRTAFTVR